MQRPDRPVIKQNFYTSVVTVLGVPTALAQSAQQSSISSLYVAIVLSLPAGGPVVLLGDQSVSIAMGNGITLPPGNPFTLSIQNQRQLYEIQAPLVDMGRCSADAIPLVVFDPTSIYLVSAAPPTLVGLILFPEAFK